MGQKCTNHQQIENQNQNQNQNITKYKTFEEFMDELNETIEIIETVQTKLDYINERFGLEHHYCDE